MCDKYMLIYLEVENVAESLFTNVLNEAGPIDWVASFREGMKT